MKCRNLLQAFCLKAFCRSQREYSSPKILTARSSFLPHPDRCGTRNTLPTHRHEPHKGIVTKRTGLRRLLYKLRSSIRPRARFRFTTRWWLTTDLFQRWRRPVVPTLPDNALVALWFGFNGNNLVQQGASAGVLAASACVNGVPNSVFGQFSYCNAPAFFKAADQAIRTGSCKFRVWGFQMMGAPVRQCEISSLRSGPSDNLPVTYLISQEGCLPRIHWPTHWPHRCDDTRKPQR